MMSNKATATKEELMQYIQMMQGLKESGIKCEQEISQALKELNKLMFPTDKKDEFKDVNIIVVEDTVTGFHESVELFSNLLQRRPANRYDSTFVVISNGNTLVRIANISNQSTAIDRLRGYRADFIVNNAKVDISELGIKVTKE